MIREMALPSSASRAPGRAWIALQALRDTGRVSLPNGAFAVRRIPALSVESSADKSTLSPPLPGHRENPNIFLRVPDAARRLSPPVQPGLNHTQQE